MMEGLPELSSREKELRKLGRELCAEFGIGLPHPERPELDYIVMAGSALVEGQPENLGLRASLRRNIPQELRARLPTEYRGERITYINDLRIVPT